jgi:transcriptional regulator NrdR family protein
MEPSEVKDILDGSQCPKCGEYETTVVQTYYSTKYDKKARRRRCKVCNHRWHTIEINIDDLKGELL